MIKNMSAEILKIWQKMKAEKQSTINTVIQEPVNVLDKHLIHHKEAVKSANTEHAIKKNKIENSVTPITPNHRNHYQGYKNNQQKFMKQYEAYVIKGGTASFKSFCKLKRSLKKKRKKQPIIFYGQGRG